MATFYNYARLADGVFRERFGLDFEDFAPGQVFHHRPGVTLSQQDNAEESLDTINNAHLHYDRRYAEQTEWKRNLLVSTLTLQRLIGMSSRTFYRRCRFSGFEWITMTHPVFGGDTLYARSHITSVEDSSDAATGRVGVTLEGINQASAIVAKVAYKVEIYRRGQHPEMRANSRLLRTADEPRFAAYHGGEDGGLIEQSGLYYEDFAPGETFEHWPARAMPAEESALHALRSLEINPRYATELFEPWALGVMTALTTRTFGRVVANLGWIDVELPRPVRPGEIIRAVSTIIDKRESANRPTQGILRVLTTAYGDDDTMICRFSRALLVYKSGIGPYAAAGY